MTPRTGMEARLRAVPVIASTVLALAIVLSAVAVAIAQAPSGTPSTRSTSAGPSRSTLRVPGADKLRPRALADREVFGFLPHWELADAAGIELDRLTTLCFFGLEAGADGSLVRETDAGAPTPGWSAWTGDAFGVLMARARAAGVRIVLVVERFAWDAAGEEATIALLGDPQSRAALVADVVATVTGRGADGVNLDFEPLPRAVRSDFTDLVRELRAGLDSVDPGLQLTFDVTADVMSYPLKPLTAPGAADGAVLMGYEYRSAGSRVAGSVAPLRDPRGLDLRESVQRALTRIPSNRVILALPWYGRAWSTRSEEPGSRTRSGDRYLGPSTAFYEAAVARTASAGRRFDRGQASAWSSYRASACQTCPVSWRQLWYDDVDSLRAKVALALDRDLRGVGIWALGYQGSGPELWSALSLALGETSDAEAPVGSAELDPAGVTGERDGLPVVGDVARLVLAADDGIGGSGLAFVRVGSRGQRLTARGELRVGTTFPAVDAVSVAMPLAGPVDDVFIPAGAAAAASPSPGPSSASGAMPSPASSPPPRPGPAQAASPVTLRVQWRDVAGNWSRPVEVRVLYQPEAATEP